MLRASRDENWDWTAMMMAKMGAIARPARASFHSPAYNESADETCGEHGENDKGLAVDDAYQCPRSRSV